MSNACGAYVRAVLDTNGAAHHFAAQLGADEVPAPKPAPDGLLMCCSTLAVDPTLVRTRPASHSHLSTKQCSKMAAYRPRERPFAKRP